MVDTMAAPLPPQPPAEQPCAAANDDDAENRLPRASSSSSDSHQCSNGSCIGVCAASAASSAAGSSAAAHAGSSAICTASSAAAAPGLDNTVTKPNPTPQPTPGLFDGFQPKPREARQLVASRSANWLEGYEGGQLVRRWGAPPFSVLDARKGYWKDRRAFWEKTYQIHSEAGRKDNLIGYKGLGGVSARGTSVFCPVLCELIYRWFVPAGGSVLDPFAGGSVRGCVAARLGLAYTGIVSAVRPAAHRPPPAQWTARSPPACRRLVHATGIAARPLLCLLGRARTGPLCDAGGGEPAAGRADARADRQAPHALV